MVLHLTSRDQKIIFITRQYTNKSMTGSAMSAPTVQEIIWIGMFSRHIMKKKDFNKASRSWEGSQEHVFSHKSW